MAFDNTTADLYKAEGWTGVIDHLDQNALGNLSDGDYAELLDSQVLTADQIKDREEGQALAATYFNVASRHPLMQISKRHNYDLGQVMLGRFHACWRNTVARARVALWVHAGGTIEKCPAGPTWNCYGEEV